MIQQPAPDAIVARGMMNCPALLLADRLTGALDTPAGEQVIDLLPDFATVTRPTTRGWVRDLRAQRSWRPQVPAGPAPGSLHPHPLVVPGDPRLWPSARTRRGRQARRPARSTRRPVRAEETPLRVVADAPARCRRIGSSPRAAELDDAVARAAEFGLPEVSARSSSGSGRARRGVAGAWRRVRRHRRRARSRASS